MVGWYQYITDGHLDAFHDQIPKIYHACVQCVSPTIILLSTYKETEMLSRESVILQTVIILQRFQPS